MNRITLNYTNCRFLLVSFMVFIPSIIFGTGTMAFKFNGHKYTLPEDYLVRAIEEEYENNQKDVIKDAIEALDDNNEDLTINTVTVPPEVNFRYSEDKWGLGSDFVIATQLDGSINIDGKYSACDFDIKIGNIGMRLVLLYQDKRTNKEMFEGIGSIYASQ